MLRWRGLGLPILRRADRPVPASECPCSSPSFQSFIKFNPATRIPSPHSDKRRANRKPQYAPTSLFSKYWTCDPPYCFATRKLLEYHSQLLCQHEAAHSFSGTCISCQHARLQRASSRSKKHHRVRYAAANRFVRHHSTIISRCCAVTTASGTGSATACLACSHKSQPI